uniref:HORMA domain-containing protein n=1 Tax=Lepisosteus oculatus TaxID=7918 RepID=W5MMH1_LEPOC
MATAQLQKTAAVSQVFPTVVSSEQQSLALVKKLMAIAVSCITYLRGLFPERAYGTKYVEDQCFKILKEDRSCPGSTQVVKWMQGCYDALQKRYLRMVVLSIFADKDSPETVTECYQFKIKYDREGPQLDFGSSTKRSELKLSCSGNTKAASILLIRRLYVLMQHLGPLPSDVCLNMKLYYYDEVTPQDYQPPGFKEGVSTSMLFEGTPVHLTVGEVVTPFHALKLKVTTEKDRLEQVGDAACFPKGLPFHNPLQEQQPMRADTNEKDCNENTVAEDSGTASCSDSDARQACQQDLRIFEGGLDSSQHSQMDSLVRQTSDLEMSVSRTRSGRMRLIPQPDQRKRGADPCGKSRSSNKSVRFKAQTPQYAPT